MVVKRIADALERQPEGFCREQPQQRKAIEQGLEGQQGCGVSGEQLEGDTGSQLSEAPTMPIFIKVFSSFIIVQLPSA